jgi:hypothetical protein
VIYQIAAPLEMMNKDRYIHGDPSAGNSLLLQDLQSIKNIHQIRRDDIRIANLIDFAGSDIVGNPAKVKNDGFSAPELEGDAPILTPMVDVYAFCHLNFLILLGRSILWGQMWSIP